MYSCTPLISDALLFISLLILQYEIYTPWNVDVWPLLLDVYYPIVPKLVFITIFTIFFEFHWCLPSFLCSECSLIDHCVSYELCSGDRPTTCSSCEPGYVQATGNLTCEGNINIK